MFTWLKSLFGGFGGAGTQTVSLVSPWLQHIIWTIKRSFLELARDAYGSNSVVYACLEFLSNAVAEPPLLAYTLDAKLEKTPLPFDHPLVRLIRDPNPLMTEFQFFKLVTIHTHAGGRAHFWIQRNNLGKPKHLWPLRPDRVGPIYAGRNPTDPNAPPVDPDNLILAGWAYMQPGLGEPIRLRVEDVLTFNFPDPAGETGGVVEGLAPLAVLAREIEGDNEATNFAAALLKNSATPGIVIRLKQAMGLTRQQGRDIKRNFMADFGGVRRGEPAVVDGDAEITQLGFSLRDLDFSALRHVSESRIAAVLGVPAILVGLEVGLTSGIKATTDEVRANFTEGRLSSLWRQYSDQYTKQVGSEFGENIICRFDMTQVKALTKQLAAQYEPIVFGFKQGAVTIDEYRVKVLQLPPFKNDIGDSLLVSTLTVATATDEDETFLDDTESGDDSEVSGETEDSGDGKAKRRKSYHGYRVENPRLLPVHAASLAPKATKAIAAPTRTPRDDDEDRVTEALSALFETMAPDVARKIAAGLPVTDDELTAAFAAVLQPLLAEIAAQEGTRLSDTYGVSFDPAEVSAAASEWAASYVPGGLAKRLSETTQKVVTATISTYLATPGMTIADLIAALQPAVSKDRAKVISVTEVTRAYAQGVSAYQERLADLGIPMVRTWRTVNSETVCIRCAPLNGKTEDEWPDDLKDGPPGHSRCRCAITLTMPEEGSTA